MNFEKTTSFFEEYFHLINKKITSINTAALKEIAELVLKTEIASNKLIFVGNGGSAAMASHLSVDFTKAAGIRAINFNEADLLTCFANDYGYDHWVAKALEAYADPGDLVFLISSSGMSKNILNGAKAAKAMQLNTITLSGFSSNNDLRQLGNINLWVDSNLYNLIEMAHHVWLLSLVDFVVELKSGRG